MAAALEGVKPLRLQLKLTNNLLQRLREDKGLTRAGLAREIGVSNSTYGRLEALLERPFGRIQRNPDVYGWKPIAQKIAAYYGVTPDLLFPGDVLAVEKTQAHAEVAAEELGSLLLGSAPLDPEQALANKECFELANELLSPRQRLVLAEHADGATLGEIGAQSLGGLSRERARQLLVGAQAQLRTAAGKR